jgi:putative glutamine amidotransferase
MTKPIIGITVSQIQTQYRIENYSPSAYAKAVALAGGLPMLIPNEYPVEELTALFDRIDGLLLSGGGDVDLSLYGGIPHPSVGGISKDRDQLECTLVKAALKNHKPVFGICRGLQLINVALGGTLYSDIPDQYPTQTQHSTPDEKGRDFVAHEVEVDQNTTLGRIMGAGRFKVNSFHHQAIQKIAPDLVVTAHATDGLIEGVELPGEEFQLLAVQWHPENLIDHEPQLKLFTAFVAACK